MTAAPHTSELKIFTCVYMPLRVFEIVENRRGKISRNQYFNRLIEAGLNSDQMKETVGSQDATVGLVPHKRQATEYQVRTDDAAVAAIGDSNGEY